MLDIDAFNRRASRRNPMEKILDGNSYVNPEDALDLSSQLQATKSILGLNTYVIPRVAEQTDDNPAIPYIALATDTGKEYLLNQDFFTLSHGDLKNNPHAESVCGSSVYRVRWEDKSVYVKHDFFGQSPHNFILMHLLEREGVHTAPLLFATQHLIVTLEVEGTLLSQLKKSKEWEYNKICYKFPQYREALWTIKQKLIKKRQWTEVIQGLDVDLDYKDSNIFVRDIESPNPLDWFTFIDCIRRFW